MPEPNIPHGFENFDNPSVYAKYEAAVLNVESLNFVIDFDSEAAFSALHVDLHFMKNILASQLKTGLEKPLIALFQGVGHSKSRWINIWMPEKQKDLVSALASYYEFSPRLHGMMASQPLTPALVVPKPHISKRQALMQAYKERMSLDKHPADPESIEMEKSSDLIKPLDLNHYRIVNEIWHFCSVDWGSKYLCIGYNSLHNTKAREENPTADNEPLPNLPHGTRLWTWLILCSDGTVISIHENPFPDHSGGLNEPDQAALGVIRYNLLNVFKQLSKANDEKMASNPMMALKIRSEARVEDGRPITNSDSPSLLFYYLFDDWHTSYSLAARREHQYGDQLEKLRVKMFEKAEIGHIDRLHHFGRQLAVLKRIYQSYALIIERILERQKLPDSSSKSTHNHFATHTTYEHNADGPLPNGIAALEQQTFEVPLASAATVRFERLRDRINLYALSEIQDCLDEKESLVSVNFNLITYKQSTAVERLTRITILLAKVTILFMPVSLMTGYFSVQIADLQGVYTATTYWACFGVVGGLSLIFLVIFGKLSGTLEGKPIYRSLSETLYDSTKHILGKEYAIGRKRKTKGF